MEFPAARRSERDEVLDLLASWYDERNSLARYNQHHPGFHGELCLVANIGAWILASAQIFDRSVNFASQAIPLGGIRSVYTHENARKRGIASELMRLAIATMTGERFELSMLFAEQTDFYPVFGWPIDNRTFTAIAGTENPAALVAAAGRDDPAGAQAAFILATHSIHEPALEKILTSSGSFLMHHEENSCMWRMAAPGKFAQHFAIPPAAAEAKLFRMVEENRSLFWADRL